ncbi:hypothetical protein RHMOL_Rhmol04G0178700 [Rhododendron molle]|uniref:Uncharacterized protein n=1 Tax=Rhododendron molle TaxID=49168 RepID=A0ACC0P3U6_RHOML|nr:hypothetical protein RHMOL_Rhmol04G0178700 [Rhododendron molle]
MKRRTLCSSLHLKTLVDRLNSIQVGEVIGDLGVEDPELAIELFYLLKNEHGLRKCSQLIRIPSYHYKKNEYYSTVFRSLSSEMSL